MTDAGDRLPICQNLAAISGVQFGMPLSNRSCWFLTSLTLLGLVLTLTGPCGPTAFAQDGSSRRSEGEGEGRRERGRGWGRGERLREGGGEDRPRSGRGEAGDRGREGGDRNREERSSSSKPAPSAAAKPAPSSSSSSMDMSEYAKSLIKQHDKNGDSMLQSDEQHELRGKPATADLNKDGTITREELVAHLSGAAASTPASAASASSSESSSKPSKSESTGENRKQDNVEDRSDKSADGKNGKKRVYTASALGGSAAKSEKAPRRSFRFTPSAERLPSGLPDWFTSKDKNHDGQVSMHEYSRSWSDRTAGEFLRHDLDGDGVVTPKEATKGKKSE